jgi:hypothetical protein
VIKKLFILLLIITLSLLVFSGCKGQIPSEGEGEGEGESEETEVADGPAPNSGDGIPDGPGWF